MSDFTFARAASGAAFLFLASAALASPFASSVASYAPGIGAPVDYQNSAVALGEPTRFTGQSFGFPASVTPFASAFEPDEVVAIGRGGSLVLQFDQPIVNDPNNPYGIDLLIFGNTFFYADDFSPVAQNLWQPGGVVEVSQDGVSWTTVPSVQADGAFPTLGYVDEVNPFGGDAGLVPTDFTKPVNPNFAWQGLGLSDLIAGYNGSGGGAGVDLSSVNLSSVSFVRLSLPANATISKIEIDAVSDVAAVPSPGAIGVLALAGVISARRRRDSR
ncbi:MAG: hypothetical protein U0640_10030 [Phycisphaerales bacterium]